MNVCIVTVYNSFNSGSFWQAKCLGNCFSDMGHNVYYLRRPESSESSASVSKQIKTYISVLAAKGIKSAGRYRKMVLKFRELQKTFNVIETESPEYGDIDLFILGSDTIWALDSKYFRENYRFFFGEELPHGKVITYAPSIAGTDGNKLAALPDIGKTVNSWRSISVRDKYTYNIIKKLTDKPVSIVCDPTLLFSKDYYEGLVSSPPIDKYIFIYMFKNLNSEQISQLKSFASEKGLRIIHGVALYPVAYCDDIIVNSPYDFLRYMLYADYVVTDTFHGTVFSVNLEKQFVTVDCGKRKALDFLTTVGFGDRIVDTVGSLTSALDRKIDYSSRKSELVRLIDASKDYIARNSH